MAIIGISTQTTNLNPGDSVILISNGEHFDGIFIEFIDSNRMDCLLGVFEVKKGIVGIASKVETVKLLVGVLEFVCEVNGINGSRVRLVIPSR